VDKLARQPAPGDPRGLLVLLLALHSLSSALILPTLPALAAAHGGQAQWAFSAFIFGFGITQIPWGLLADRCGRRPPLLSGLLLFACAATCCVFATQLHELIVLRFLQGAGVAAAGVCARAIIRDLHSGEACVRALSLCFSWIGAISLAGPLLIALLAEHYDRSATLAVYAGLGWLALLLCMFRLPETASPAPRSGELRWQTILAHPVFRVYTALTAFTYLGHYTFLTGSAFLLMGHYGMGAPAYAAVLSACSLCYMAGTVAGRRLLARVGLQRTVCRASLLGLAGATLMLAAALAGGAAPAAIVAPYLLFAFAHAIHQSCGQGAAIAPFPDAAGQASALLGTALPTIAVLIGWLCGARLADSPLAMPVVVFASAVLVALCAGLGVRRYGAIRRLPC